MPAARVVFAEDDRRAISRLVDESLTSGSLTLGPHTRAFEDAFAARHSARHAVATSSGTSALEIVFRAVGVAGAEVVVPANTFYATAAAVVAAGGRPRLADADAATLSVSAATVAAALTPATRVVVVVHIGGTVSPETPAIARLCRQAGVALVEDAAHAHGADLDGVPAGAFGDAATFSFYPTKVLTAGEGGMILTGDGSLADEARIYRDQGKAGFLGGAHVRAGSAWRMSELHAAVGLTHLGRLDGFLAVRRAMAARYDAALAGVGGVTVIGSGPGGNVYKYPVLLAPGLDRDAVRTGMRERGVSLSGEVYATPLHREPVFAGIDHPPLPVAEDVCARHVCLPVHSDMTDAEADRVLDALGSVLSTLSPG